MKSRVEPALRIIRGLSWLLVGTGGLGLAIAACFGHDLIRAIYDGKSISLLNQVIEGQANHSVENYFQTFDALLRTAALAFVVATSLGLMGEVTKRLESRSLPAWLGFTALLAIPIGLVVGGIAFQSPTATQVGVFTASLVSLTGLIVVIGRKTLDQSLRTLKGLLLRTTVFLGIFALTFEIALRMIFFSGESFGLHGGPIIARFERDFVFNRFDGPSRGPATEGVKVPGTIRILVQGDSITWGQGVRDEHSLFTSRLLDLFRREDPSIEMAVLAQPGRDIDGHRQQLKQWGNEIAPDVIVYQWFVNDMELDHSGQPWLKERYWRRLFFHRELVSNSYFWFMFDFGMGMVLPASGQSYETYMATHFDLGTPGWNQFRGEFETWLAEARRLTPNVLIALYPSFVGKGEPSLTNLYGNFQKLCEELGVDVIDLWKPLRILADQPDRLFASRFDAHPGPMAHEIIAMTLHEKLRAMGVPGS